MESVNKIKLATVWLGGCAGCHMSFLDLDEWLFELAQKVDLVFSPIADVKEFPEGVDVVLVEGAIANEDNLALVKKARARSKVLVSFGDCAVTGNVTALRNTLGLSNADAVLDRAYKDGALLHPHLPDDTSVVPPLARTSFARPRRCARRPLSARLPAPSAPHSRLAGTNAGG